MKRLFSCLVLAALLAGFLPGNVLPVQRASAQGPGAAEKVSGRLDLEVRAKVEAVRPRSPGATPFPQRSAPTIPLEAMPATARDVATQLIFIHLAQPPTRAEIDDMLADGVVPYPDSWIPPVGNQTTGFITAEMPVDRLAALAGRTYVQRLETAETSFTPQNDLAAQAMGVPAVWSSGYNGTGVRVAVLDSGLDLTNPDIPNPVARKDYSAYPVLDDTIANTVTGHGTHVTGSVLGRGTASSGVYKGIAPGADLVFLKIGNDTNGSSTTAAIVAAMKAAVDTYGAKVITMSYGGWDDYHDGSSEEAQAVDYAVSRGATVFLSAGNDAASAQHYSGTVGPLSSTGDIRVNVTNALTNDVFLQYDTVWYDGPAMHNDLVLEYYNSSHTLIATSNLPQADSPRGTESEYSYYGYVPPGNSTWYLRVRNSSQSSQFFHIYYVLGGSKVAFDAPDPDYTIASPADADSAIAVGAYTTRRTWYDYANNGWQYSSQTVGQIATFSDHGPRVDAGAPQKPNIVAPGAVIISARDNVVYPSSGMNSSYVDNDGPNVNDNARNNGAGPADYYIMQGTSMASPIAAGVAALLLQKHPTWTPVQVRNAMQSTATDKGAVGPDGTYGYGLVNAEAAFSIVQTVTTDSAGGINASSANISGTLTSLGMASSANVSFQYGTSSGNYTQNTPVQVKNGPASFSANITGLSANTTYYFRAKASGDGTSYGTEKSFATTIAAPAAPSGLTASAVSPTRVDLTWLDNATTETGYRIERARDANFVNSLVTVNGPANVPAFSDNTVAGGTAYFYRVLATGAGGASAPSNTATVTTPAVPVTPAVTSVGADNIAATSVRLNGNLTSLGTAATANVSFQWGANPGNYTFETGTVSINATGLFSANVSGLSANTTYYFRARAAADGVTFGQEMSFTTLPAVPIVDTSNATGVGLTSGRLNGTLVSLGAASTSNVSFQWGSSPGNYTGATPVQTPSTTGPFFADLTGLSENVTYYFRARASGNGTAYGAERSFTTLASPSVSTGNATALTLTSAQVIGSLTSLGSAASANVSFQWGTASGNLTLETAPVAVNLAGPFTAAITGLSANTTYYYRAHAVGHGAAFGGEASFTTPVARALTTAVNGGGSVSPAAGIHQYPLGSSVSISAVPASGWQFGSWTGNVTNPNSAATSVFLDIDKTATANFVPLPAPPASGGGGGGGGSSGGGGGGGGANSVSLTGLSADTQLYVNASGYVQSPVKLASPDSACTLEIPAGATLTTASGTPVTTLTRGEPPSPPQPQGGKSLIAIEEFGPDGATFSVPLTLTLSFDRTRLPSGVSDSDLVIAFWDGAQWVTMNTSLNREASSLSTRVSHFTMFGILAPVVAAVAPAAPPAPSPPAAAPPAPPVYVPLAPVVPAEAPVAPAAPPPAAFRVSGLSVAQSGAPAGGFVQISALVANIGGATGDYVVVLKIDGVEQDRTAISLAAGDSRTVSFTAPASTTGAHTLDINGEAASFEVFAPPPPSPDLRAAISPSVETEFNGGRTIPLTAAAILLGALVYFGLSTVRRRRRSLH